MVRLLLAGALCSGLCACGLVKLSEESKAFYSSTVLVGRVDAPVDWVGPIVVAAVQRELGQISVVHATLLHEPGGYELIAPLGEYALFAFGDTNRNGVYDGGEPCGQYTGPTKVVATGEGVLASLDIVIGDAASALVPAGTLFVAPPRHSTQAGALADLDAPLFSAASGSRDYWAPIESFRSAGGNVYFLEPYDPNKTPVLFVHGAAGSAQDWRHIFQGIDRKRFQPWFFQYPSGAALDSMAYLLYWSC